MPYKSRAQAAKFHILESQGKIAPAVVNEWDAASKGKMSNLPEHVKPLAKGGKKKKR